MLKINSEKLIVSVKPYGENKNYSDSVFNLKIAPENKETCISLAEIALKEEIPLLTLSSYRECEKTGNRDNFEIKYFKKRKMLLELTAGEIADGFKGRFLEKAMDLMWSICEETTWVIPAHRQKESYPNCNWVDIMSASTGGVMAAAYFFLEKEIQKEMPEGFLQRILYELRHRVTDPFMSDFSPFHSWKGTEGWYVNNWTPWIVQNALSVIVFTEKDMAVRKKTAGFAAMYLNRYLSFCSEDGACVEGAAYYYKANGSVFDIAELFCELTDNEYNILKDPYIKKLAEYIPNMYTSECCHFTAGDCGANGEFISADVGRFIKRMSVTLESESLTALKQVFSKQKLEPASGDHYTAYRGFKNLSVVPSNKENTFKLRESYMESVQIMTLRRDFCTAFFKGGNNNEPHGHNDIGEFELYLKNEPLFIDPGVEVYSSASFGPNRGWCYSSYYHNTPCLNGKVQSTGYQGSPDIKFRAEKVKADLKNGEMSMDITSAYENLPELKFIKRKMSLNGGVFEVADSYEFEKSLGYEFHLMTVKKPRISKGELKIAAGDKEITCSFNSDYDIKIEEIPVTDRRISGLWNTDRLFCTKISAEKQKDCFNFSARIL